MGAPLGKRQAGKDVVYDPSSGRTYRSTFTLSALEAVKFVTAAQLTGVSASGLIRELLRRMEVDDEGRPIWADELADPAQPLPLNEHEVA